MIAAHAPTLGDEASTGDKGIRSRGVNKLNIVGRQVSIGQVETYRLGVPNFDSPKYINISVDPAAVFKQDQAPTVDGVSLDNCPGGTCTSQVCNGGSRHGHICDHAVAVAGVVISVGKDQDPQTQELFYTSVAAESELWASAFITVTPQQDAYRDVLRSAQHVALQDAGDVRAINFSFGLPGTLDGASLLTTGLDWSATAHDVLYVQARGNLSNSIAIVPRDLYNGIVVAGSSKDSQQIFNRVASFNRFDLATDGRRLTHIVAPGRDIKVPVSNNSTGTSSGTSFSAPHVTGTVALLQDFAERRIRASTDPWGVAARLPRVMKAVLMNSANKVKDAGDGKLLGMDKTILDAPEDFTDQNGNMQYDNGEPFSDSNGNGVHDSGGLDWLASDAAASALLPLDDQLGTGQLDAQRALTQFAPGERDADGPDVPAMAWDEGQTDFAGDVNKYVFDDPLELDSYVSITLTWERRVSLVENGTPNGMFEDGETFNVDGLTNLDLYLLPQGAASILDAVCSSTSVKYNVEHIFCKVPADGNYEIWVRQVDAPLGVQSYAVAWWAQGVDCNMNGVPDSQDIASGTSDDCNANGVPDDCDGGGGVQSQFISIVNNTGQAAADLHLTFSSGGGSMFVKSQSVHVTPDLLGTLCALPAVPSNPPIVTNTMILDWGVTCVDPGARVTFRICTPAGPLQFDSGYWSGQGGADIGTIQAADLNDCPNTGACCLSDNTCNETDDVCCTGMEGAFNAGADCQATGSCCAAGGSCSETSSACCTAQGTTFNAGATCDATGACTVGGSCFSSTVECCAAEGGAFQAAQSCPSGSCDILPAGGGKSASFEGKANLERVVAKYGGKAGARRAQVATGIQASIDQNGHLLVLGSTADDDIALRLKTGDPMRLQVVDLNGGSLDFFEFAVDDFVAIDVLPGDGADLVVFDDANGVVSDVAPFTIDSGDGDDILIGGTGSHTLQQVLDIATLLQSAQALITQADALVQRAGGVAPLGDSGDNVISAAALLAQNINSVLVTPATDYLSDVRDGLVLPATDVVKDTYNIILPQVSSLLDNAYTGLVQQSMCKFGGVCSPSATPEDYSNQASYALQTLGELYVKQAEVLQDSATQLMAKANVALASEGSSELQSQLDQLAAQLDAIAETCPEDYELPAPPPAESVPDAQLQLPSYCQQRGGSRVSQTLDRPGRLFELEQRTEHEDDLIPSTSVAFDCRSTMESIIACMEQLGDRFAATADECLQSVDKLELAGENFSNDVNANLVAAADALELEVDNSIVPTADALVTDAETFESSTESFYATAEATLAAQGQVFESRGDAELVQTGETLGTQAENDFGDAETELTQLADDLVASAEALIASTVAVLEGQRHPVNRINVGDGCANVTTNNTIVGGSGANLLIGTSGNDMIMGLGGTDVIVGLAGDDVLHGDADSDVIFGGSGKNELRGGDGVDLLIGGNDKDCEFGEDDYDVMLGRGGSDEMDGGNQVDLALGGDGDDLIKGSAGVDVLIGQAGADEVRGDECIDVIVGGEGNDSLYGGAGQVVTIGGVSLDLGDVILGGSGDDIEHGDDDLDLGSGVDAMFGGSGKDHIFGANGGDLKVNNFTLKLGNAMFGGPGNDEMRSKQGVDAMFGGPGKDTMYAGVGFNLELNGGSFKLDLGDFLFGGPDADTMHGDDPGGTGIDFVFGGPGGDVMHGYEGGDLVTSSFTFKIGNVMFGQDGADKMDSQDGVDFLFGGPDGDTMSAGKGYTLILDGGDFIVTFGDFEFGGDGDDMLHGDVADESSGHINDGIDVLFGGPGDDKLYGGSWGEIFINPVFIVFGGLFFGEPGDDLLRGDYEQTTGSTQNGIDLMLGGVGNDTLEGQDGGFVSIGLPPYFAANFGNIEFGGPGTDSLDGETGMDLQFGGDGPDTIDGGVGIDLQFGSQGDDTMYGGDGGLVTIVIDAVPVPISFGNLQFGGDDEDTLDSEGVFFPPLLYEIDLQFGNDCDDTIRGGAGLLDLQFGNRGDDTMYGEASIDLMFGNRGRDTLYGGDGIIDLEFGNHGDDHVFGEAGVDLTFGGHGDDEVDGGDGLINLEFGGMGNDIVRGGLGLDLAFGNSDQDLVLGQGALDLVFGNDDADVVYGGSSFDLVFGNAGDDTVGGDCDPSALSCIDGPDLVFGNTGKDTLHGGGGPDFLFGGGGQDVLKGEASADLVFGNGDDDKLFGGPGIDLLFGGQGSDVVFGEADADLVFGGDGSDNLSGGGDRDLIFGNGGMDTLFGDEGRDLSFGNADHDQVDGGDDRDFLFGNSGPDDVLGAGFAGVRDYIFGNQDDDNVEGGLDGNTPRDLVFGNHGNDQLYYCDPDHDKLFGGAGTDTKHDACSGIVPTRVYCGALEGTKTADLDGNGTGDTGLGGVTVFLDFNANGILNFVEPSTQTSSSGHYSFSFLAAGTYHVQEVVPQGYTRTVPAGDHTVSLSLNQTISSLDFVNRDECRPTSGGAGCEPCPCPGQIVPSYAGRCSNNDAPCTSNQDCACGGLCTQKVVECECVVGLSSVSFDSPCYECGETMTILIADNDGSFGSPTIEVLDTNGGTVDVDHTVLFVFTGGDHVFVGQVPTSCGIRPVADDGILDVLPGYVVRVIYEEANAAPVVATVTVQQQCPEPEVEPNGECQVNANPVQPGDMISAAILPACDRDAFKLELTDNAFVSVSTTGGDASDTLCRVVDCTTLQVLACDNDSGPGPLSLMEGCLAPGNYCVQCRGVSTSTFSYGLQIQATGGCVPPMPPVMSGDGSLQCPTFDLCP